MQSHTRGTLFITKILFRGKAVQKRLPERGRRFSLRNVPSFRASARGKPAFPSGEKKAQVFLQRFWGDIVQSLQSPGLGALYILFPVVDEEAPGRIQIIPLNEGIVYFGLRLESPDLPGDDTSVEKREKVVFGPHVMIALFDEVGEHQQTVPPEAEFFENPHIRLQRGENVEDSRPEGVEKFFVGSHLFPKESGSLLEGKSSPIQVVPMGRKKYPIHKEIRHMGICRTFQEMAPGIPIQKNPSDIENYRVNGFVPFTGIAFHKISASPFRGLGAAQNISRRNSII
jgi:hypothetical protein